jgi:hypothetical protein
MGYKDSLKHEVHFQHKGAFEGLALSSVRTNREVPEFHYPVLREQVKTCSSAKSRTGCFASGSSLREKPDPS